MTLALGASTLSAASPALGALPSSVAVAGLSNGALTTVGTGKALGATAAAAKVGAAVTATKVGLALAVVSAGSYFAATGYTLPRPEEAPSAPMAVQKRPAARSTAPVVKGSPPKPSALVRPEDLPVETAPPIGAPRKLTPGAEDQAALGASAEALLIDKAHAALRTNPEAALELVRQHRQRFPKGLARPEAEAIQIEALLKLGRKGEASTSLRSLESADPSSAHIQRLRSALGTSESVESSDKQPRR